MAEMVHPHRVLGMALLATAALATGCGSRSAATIASSGGSSTSAPVTIEAKGPLAVGDADNGTSATVSVGQRIIVTLASTYWTLAAPTAAQVVGQEGQPSYAPGGPTCPKIPGTGCGTVVAVFTALAPGEADLAADRTSCGEALRCSDAQAHWRLHVRVLGPTPALPPTTVTTTAVVATTTIAVTKTTLAPPSTSTSLAFVGSTGVQGAVLFSPVCPVERIPPDPACAPRPGQARIQVQRADGSVVVEVVSGLDGRFTVSVAPGSYMVTAAASAPGPGRRCQVQPPQVTVVSGSYVTVSVSCDTGIR